MQLFTIAYVLMNATASAMKPEGCFHPSKVMQFRSVLMKEFGMKLIWPSIIAIELFWIFEQTDSKNLSKQDFEMFFK